MRVVCVVVVVVDAFFSKTDLFCVYLEYIHGVSLMS